MNFEIFKLMEAENYDSSKKIDNKNKFLNNKLLLPTTRNSNVQYMDVEYLDDAFMDLMDV